MWLREASGKTLADLRAEMTEDGTQTVVTASSEVRIDLVEEKSIAFGEDQKFTVPADREAVTALGNWLEVPSKFLLRTPLDLQQTILMRLLAQQPGNFTVRFTDAGILEIRDPAQAVIPPSRLLEVAQRVLDPAAEVIDFWATMDDFRLDVIVPRDFDRGVGGDPQVGDITCGGIRIGQDRKHNLAPWVSPFMRRLTCTNGMECEDEGLKVDARGQSVEEVLAQFEEAADRAFRRVEQEIEHFYSLRSEKVDHPEQALIRMAQENGLPDRMRLALVERVPAFTDEEGMASLFDLVNLITNQANDPSIRGRAGVRRRLEMTGGAIISQQAERCGHCLSKLTD